MGLKEFRQPEIIPVTSELRLRKFDGNYAAFLPGYRDPVVYQNSEGIFDESRIPDLDYVTRMCQYLSKAGELYYIEANVDGQFLPIGDVTIKAKNPPIAIWDGNFRGKGIGTLVMQTVIRRLKELGYSEITGSTVYRWNTASRNLHEKLGFEKTGEQGQEILYRLSPL